MKRITSLFLLSSVLIGIHSAEAALSVNWSSTNNVSSFIPSVQAGWEVALYVDPNGDTTLSGITSFNTLGQPTGGSSSDDYLFYVTPMTSSKGVFQYALNPVPGSASLANMDVYTVIYNSSTNATATTAYILDPSTRQLPSDGLYSYNPNGGVSYTVGVVPEPTTISLLAIGLVAVALRRKKAA